MQLIFITLFDKYPQKLYKNCSENFLLWYPDDLKPHFIKAIVGWLVYFMIFSYPKKRNKGDKEGRMGEDKVLATLNQNFLILCKPFFRL
jgi:hypothetical protein